MINMPTTTMPIIFFLFLLASIAQSLFGWNFSFPVRNIHVIFSFSRFGHDGICEACKVSEQNLKGKDFSFSIITATWI